MAGISRSSAYEWRNADKSFADAWDEAEQIAVDSLEQVAWDRAKGKGEDRSDRMLEILLKAHRREKYVERVAAELTGKDGAPLQHAHAVIEITAEMTPDQAAEAYAKLLR